VESVALAYLLRSLITHVTQYIYTIMEIRRLIGLGLIYEKRVFIGNKHTVQHLCYTTMLCSGLSASVLANLTVCEDRIPYRSFTRFGFLHNQLTSTL